MANKKGINVRMDKEELVYRYWLIKEPNGDTYIHDNKNPVGVSVILVKIPRGHGVINGSNDKSEFE